MYDLEEQFQRWSISDWEVSYPRGARLTSYAEQSRTDRTVKLTYKKNGATVVLVMDKQERAVDNLRVLYLAIEALRLNEKRGLGEIVSSAYAQLAAPTEITDPYEILGVRLDADRDVIEAAYRAKAKAAHPDAGGSARQMDILNKAIQQIRNGAA